MDDENDISKLLTKKIGKKFIEQVKNFSKKYAEENNIEFMEDSIFETKMDELKDVLMKNKELIKDLKKNESLLKNICYLKPEQLYPDRYSDIINKKNIEEYRKNNKATSDAFTCSKCKSKKTTISERQTRSGDEPATIFITCVECSFCFKM